MPVEIAFKVGAPPPGSSFNAVYQDGMPVICMQPGQFFSTAEMNNWLDNDVEPAGLAQLTMLKQEEQRHYVKRLRETIDPAVTVEEKAAIAECAEPDMAKIVVNAQSTYDDIQADGWDTNWGYLDLKLGGTIVISDLEKQDDMECCCRPIDTDRAGLEPTYYWARRCVRIQYENLFTQTYIDRLNDPADLVACPRSTPVTWAQAREEVPKPA